MKILSYSTSERWETSDATINVVYKPPTQKHLSGRSVTLRMFSPEDCFHDKFPALRIPANILVGGRLDLESMTISMDSCEFTTWKTGKNMGIMLGFKDSINCSTVLSEMKATLQDTDGNAAPEVNPQQPGPTVDDPVSPGTEDPDPPHSDNISFVSAIAQLAEKEGCIKLDLWNTWCISQSLFIATVQWAKEDENDRVDFPNMQVIRYTATFVKVYTGRSMMKKNTEYSLWLIRRQGSDTKIIAGDTVADVRCVAFTLKNTRVQQPVNSE
ncbi:unnamed protein product [Cylicocyclus nassatus]|uniref:Uncharacterized protein n=1 Tax=Cylicocyclus nassatus TaxID=53992 RepID=A0AA36GXX1_CYLNA|nr:unnamed protein product [Cylicocyclus nassatus]